MSFVERSYEEIVRDLLTTLTGGTVRETLPAPVGDGLLVPEKLRNRPVRRISSLDGFTVLREGMEPVRYRFTAADFELISTTGDESNKDAIRFREGGRRPAPGTMLTVNYYPVQTPPVPLTDLNVGSVVRTLMETIAREVALSYLNLKHVYESAFLETAEGASLDKVVALVGVRRLPAGHPVVKARFSRREGVPGQITIPAGTPLTDDKGNRYLTLDSLTLEPYETTREVLAGGESPGTEPVAEGALNRTEIAIAGISAVTNPEPARRLSTPETDEQLRLRARGALHGTVRGTLEALRFGLLSIPGVNDVAITEAPNGVYGEIKIDVAYASDDPEARRIVTQRIEELRPAGIRVVPGEASRLRTRVRVQLTLASLTLSGSELNALNGAIEGRIAEYLSGISPGGTVRRAQLASLALQDARVVDAKVFLLPDGLLEAEEMTLQPGQVLDVVRPFTFPPPEAEEPGVAPAITSTVNAVLPIHLLAGVTMADATQAINLAIDSHLATRRSDAPLTVDGLAAAIRDDTRFALVRSEAIVTVETADNRFLQLTDGVGVYMPAPTETLKKGTVNIQPREGGIPPP